MSLLYNNPLHQNHLKKGVNNELYQRISQYGGVLPIDASLYTRLDAGTDLNDLTTPGVYIATNANAATLLNMPTHYSDLSNKSFKLTVAETFISLSGIRYKEQVLEPRYNEGCFWKRDYEANEGTWGTWYRYTGAAD